MLDRLNEAERDSLAHNVTLANLARVELAIGSDEEIEAVLFWDRGGKFDEPGWQALTPWDQASADLMATAREHWGHLRKLAVEYQRRADLTLFSQFNPALLYTGLAGACRVDAAGAPATGGAGFRGVEFRLIGSVGQKYQSLSLWPGKDGIAVGLGPAGSAGPQGIVVNAGDHHSALQLAQLVTRDLEKLGVAPVLSDLQGRPVAIEPKKVRLAAREGTPLDFPPELLLRAGRIAASPAEALELADALASAYYQRYGLEAEVFNLGRRYGNFSLLRNENFPQFLSDRPSPWPGLVIFTATLACRRCRRELAGFNELAASFPGFRFAVVNLNAPHARFHERVFGDLAGGDPDDFRKNATGATPFAIVYRPDAQGVLRFAEYLGTPKDAPPPALAAIRAMLLNHFTPAAGSAARKES